MASKVTPQDIITMNELYLKYHTYSETARQTGFSASTVKKYIVPNYISQSARSKIIFNDDMFKPIDLNIFVQNCDNLGNICAYSDEEYDEIKALWEELDI